MYLCADSESRGWWLVVETACFAESKVENVGKGRPFPFFLSSSSSRWTITAIGMKPKLRVRPLEVTSGRKMALLASSQEANPDTVHPHLIISKYDFVSMVRDSAFSVRMVSYMY